MPGVYQGYIIIISTQRRRYFIMKKFLVILVCFVFISVCTLAANGAEGLKTGIAKYKRGDYVGCMQIMEGVVKDDPSNALAHYYLGMSYARIGMKKEASGEYNKVIALNKNSYLTAYAHMGIKMLGDIESNETLPTTPAAGEISKTPSQQGSKTDFMSEGVKNTLIEKNLNSVIDNANKNNAKSPESIKQVEELTKKKSLNTTPSSEEVAQAMVTLSKAGMANPYGQNVDPQMMQMNMLMGMMGGGMNTNSNTGYNPANMMPLLMMQQGEGKNIDPQVMQSMITGMMMPNMSMFGGENNNNNY